MLPPPPAHPLLRRCPSLHIIAASRPQATRSPSVGGASLFPPIGIIGGTYSCLRADIRRKEWSLRRDTGSELVSVTIYWFRTGYRDDILVQNW